MGKVKAILEELTSGDIRSTQMLFIKRTRSCYVTYSPNMNQDLRTSLLDLIKINLADKAENLDGEMIYNPCKNLQGKISLCSHEYVGSYDELMESLNNPLEELNSEDAGKLSFYCFICDVEYNGLRKKYYFLRRLLNYRTLQKRGFLGISIGNRYEKIDNAVLGIDSVIDLICTESEVIVLSHSSVEKVFRLSEALSKKADKVLAHLKDSNKIENYDVFYKDCQTITVKKRLANLSENQALLDEVIQNMGAVEQVITTRGLGIEVSDGKIVYEGKNQLIGLLRILQDVFYISEITRREGVDD